ncbi:MAG TPA: nucleotidyltransferase family protein [Gemmatimonadota bacterium]|nr:nucleotidyltransferase family protein [Gemmatimonadota bacterium]
MSVAGVVLAAGRSSRMGSPKPLLDLGGETFLDHAVEVLRDGGCEPVVVVLPASGKALDRERRIAAAAGAVVIENPNPGAEQIDSLRLALASLGSETAAAVVLPVDHPQAGPDVVAALIAAFRARGAPLVRPVHRGTPGHPVLFARRLWPELAEPDLVEGARDVVHRHHDEMEEVPVEEHGVTVDVNTPEEYEREVKKPPHVAEP